MTRQQQHEAHGWHWHPVVRSDQDLSFGERAADAMRNGMGSWGFVAVALLILALWMVLNGSSGPDPYPFILLNLMLSCLAALQGAILLIAAKRADQVTAELAMHHYTETSQLDGLLAENTALTGQVHELLKVNTELTRALVAHLQGDSVAPSDTS